MKSRLVVASLLGLVAVAFAQTSKPDDTQQQVRMLEQRVAALERRIATLERTEGTHIVPLNEKAR